MAAVLKEKGIDSYGVKTTIRDSARAGIIDDPELWLKFADDRNLTAHTYKEDEARSIYARIKAFPPLVEELIEKVKTSAI